MNRTESIAGQKGRILFVDDEPSLLEAIERTMRRARAAWECEYVGDAREAISRMKARSFHVVVSDMRMPGMNGVELLAQLVGTAPDTVRVMLTGNADLQTALDAVNKGHVFQFLLKPCGGERLIQSLAAALRQHEMQQAERELFQTKILNAEKMTVIGQLAAGINHDLNNILATIMLRSEQALLNSSADSPLASALSLIQEAATRAAGLTSELNGFSRSDQGEKFQEVDLREVAEASTRIVRPMLNKQIDLCVEVPADLPRIYGDAGKLKQVFLNLFINARDAISGKGKIRVSAHSCLCPQAFVASNPSCDPSLQQVCLSVSDDGCGMDEATKKRIFEPFFTTKDVGKGTGLGLFMIRKILELHNGSFEVESAVGQGTTFRLFLPAIESCQPKAPYETNFVC